MDDGVNLVNEDDSSLMTSHLISTLDESYIHHLFELEQHHMLTADYKRHCIDDQHSASIRSLCIRSMLQVRDHFIFTPSTALLAVNYCDRFLSSRLHDPFTESEMYQLVSVVCVLLAAKMDNLASRQSAVKLLSILNPEYPIDRERVLETDLMVLKELNWELRSATPIDFIPYFMSKLPQLPPTVHLKGLADIASDLILDTTPIPCFLGYPPSVIGAAAVLWANVPFNITSYDQGSLYESIDQEAVRRCYRDMEVFLRDATSALTSMHESLV